MDVSMLRRAREAKENLPPLQHAPADKESLAPGESLGGGGTGEEEERARQRATAAAALAEARLCEFRRQLEEQQQAEAEVAGRRAEARAEAERQRAERKRQHAAEAAAEEEAARAELEEQRREAEAASKVAAEEAEALLRRAAEEDQRVAAFLSAHGFRSAVASRRTFLRVLHPLHVAVAQNDAEMVRLLLGHGADPRCKNSSGLTPYQMAVRSNKAGSHAGVLLALECDISQVLGDTRVGSR